MASMTLPRMVKRGVHYESLAQTPLFSVGRYGRYSTEIVSSHILVLLMTSYVSMAADSSKYQP